MNRLHASLWLAAMILLLGCTPPELSQESRASQATLSACRQRADEVFRSQNRGALFTQDQRLSPESGLFNSGITTRGLADRFTWDSQVSDCVRTQNPPTPTPGGPQP